MPACLLGRWCCASQDASCTEAASVTWTLFNQRLLPGSVNSFKAQPIIFLDWVEKVILALQKFVCPFWFICRSWVSVQFPPDGETLPLHYPCCKDFHPSEAQRLSHATIAAGLLHELRFADQSGVVPINYPCIIYPRHPHRVQSEESNYFTCCAGAGRSTLMG